MEFRILGPLRVLRSGAPVAITGRHHPKALAMLVEDANRVVPVDRLIGALWEGTPPDTAEQQVQNVISGLRRRLGPDGTRLTRVGRGYRIEAAVEEVDLLRCKAIVAEARLLQRTGRNAAAIEAFRRALAEGDGPSLAGLAGRSIETLAERLDEFRLSIAEERIALELEAGQGEDLIVELRGLLAAHQLRQRLAEQLMLALHRSGRSPEALEVFTDVRERVAAAYGVDPGPPLRNLHVAILREDPALHRPRESEPPPDSDRPPAVPATLPRAVRGFTGRADSLQALDDLLADGPGLAAITGTGGIGKSTLAIHWAHRVAERFPDGQLYLDMRGFDPSGHPLTAAEAVGFMLEALGVSPGRAPSDETARIGLYRSLIANRRILVVLDNARDAGHVRSLIPGGSGCFTVVTSRNRLSGLTAAQGARPVILGMLDTGEANELLERRLGHERVWAEPEAAQRIIAACMGLPLALAIASARAAIRPDFPLETFAAELVAARDNLDAFGGDDPATDARTVFSWSYRALSVDAARMFRLFGLHPGPDCSVPAAASLAAVPVDRARALLSELTSAHLVDEHRPGRFRCHDLLRVYAGELVGEIDGEDTARLATERMLDHYLHTAHAAAVLLDAARDPITLPPKAADVVAEPIEEDMVHDWWNAELSVVLTSVHLAADRGFHRHAWQIAWSVTTTAFRVGLWHEGLATVEVGLESAERIEDASAQIQLHQTLARYRSQLGDHERGYAHLDRALELCGEGDQVLLARIHRSYGLMYGRQHRYSDALAHGLRSLRIFQELGHLRGETTLLNAVGWYYAQLGHLDEALDHCRRALDREELFGARLGRASTLDSIAFVHLRMGQVHQAVECLHEAAEVFREAGDRANQADIVARLGDAYLDLGRPDDAEEAWRRAYDLLAEIDRPTASGIAEKIRKLGESREPTLEV